MSSRQVNTRNPTAGNSYLQRRLAEVEQSIGPDITRAQLSGDEAWLARLQARRQQLIEEAKQKAAADMEYDKIYRPAHDMYDPEATKRLKQQRSDEYVRNTLEPGVSNAINTLAVPLPMMQAPKLIGDFIKRTLK